MMNWKVIFQVPTNDHSKKPFLRSYLRMVRTAGHSRLATQTLVVLEREGVDAAIKWVTEFQGPPKM